MCVSHGVSPLAARTHPDPEVLAERLVETAAKIGDLLRHEAGSVADPDAELSRAVQTHKRDLVRDLREATSALSAHGDLPERWPDERRAALRRSLLEMHEAVQANARALEIKIETGRHLMNAVTAAVRSKIAEGPRYEPAPHTPRRAIGERAKPVLINQVA